MDGEHAEEEDELDAEGEDAEEAEEGDTANASTIEGSEAGPEVVDLTADSDESPSKKRSLELEEEGEDGAAAKMPRLDGELVCDGSQLTV